MKFHEDRCKGEAVMRMKTFYLTMRLQTDRQTDRQTTDGQGDSSIPPLTSLPGYNKKGCISFFPAKKSWSVSDKSYFLLRFYNYCSNLQQNMQSNQSFSIQLVFF